MCAEAAEWSSIQELRCGMVFFCVFSHRSLQRDGPGWMAVTRLGRVGAPVGAAAVLVAAGVAAAAVIMAAADAFAAHDYVNPPVINRLGAQVAAVAVLVAAAVALVVVVAAVPAGADSSTEPGSPCRSSTALCRGPTWTWRSLFFFFVSILAKIGDRLGPLLNWTGGPRVGLPARGC